MCTIDSTDFVAESVATNATADDLYRLGLSCSTGQGVALDLVEAHKWFNLAALRGNEEAKLYRREIAEQLTSGEIAQAQAAAREWLSQNEMPLAA